MNYTDLDKITKDSLLLNLILVAKGQYVGQSWKPNLYLMLQIISIHTCLSIFVAFICLLCNKSVWRLTFIEGASQGW